MKSESEHKKLLTPMKSESKHHSEWVSIGMKVTINGETFERKLIMESEREHEHGNIQISWKVNIRNS